MATTTYDTSDFPLTVTLYTLGHRLLRVDKSDPKRAVFIFQYEPDIYDDVQAFFNDGLSLNPRTVLFNTRMVKDRLHSGV